MEIVEHNIGIKVVHGEATLDISYDELLSKIAEIQVSTGKDPEKVILHINVIEGQRFEIFGIPTEFK